MKMFGQKKAARSTSGQKKHDLGMFGMGMDFDPTAGMEDGDDDDFEAELAALQGGQPRKTSAKPKKKYMDISAIDALAAECMKDVENVSDSDDVDDADLLAELEGLSPMDSGTSLDNTPALVPSQTSKNSENKSQGGDASVIAERKTMYQTAIANAEKSGDTGKARRYKRGLKEIEKMLKAAQAGKAVDMAELPPLVALVDDISLSSSETMDEFKGNCHNCGEKGHRAPDCKEKHNRNLKRRTCFRCGRPGHIARNCWRGKRRAEAVNIFKNCHSCNLTITK